MTSHAACLGARRWCLESVEADWPGYVECALLLRLATKVSAETRSPPTDMTPRGRLTSSLPPVTPLYCRRGLGWQTGDATAVADWGPRIENPASSWRFFLSLTSGGRWWRRCSRLDYRMRSGGKDREAPRHLRRDTDLGSRAREDVVLDLNTLARRH